MPEKEKFYKQPTHPKLTSNKELVQELPEKIGPYTIEALLDKGGMSYLFLGTHPETKKPLAIKVLSEKYISNKEVVQRFLNEAEIISMTNHPNIIKMYGHGEWEGGLYIAMEYIEGTSLRKYLQQNPLSLKRALGIIIDIAYALCHLHTHGVIHRDLKPENILVMESGSIKVIDFGIAQLLTEKVAPDEPPKQRLIGTPIYISPEQKENPETVGYPSDIYSLGIISYELILGKLSHGQIHLSLIPKGMQPVLHKCLQPDPEERYQDIVDFITDVSAYLNSPSIQKDRIVGDQLSELSEEMRQLQSSLVPESAPQWPETEIGIVSYKELNVYGVYYDFFELSDHTFAIFLGESSATGAQSFLKTAILRGMVHTLYQLARSPGELITVLNDLLIKDNLGPIFNLNYLILNPKENLIRYISCGEGNLWSLSKGKKPKKLGSHEMPIGIDREIKCEEMTLPWNVGDSLILNTIPAQGDLESAIKDDAKTPPQQQVENMLRKIRIRLGETMQDRSLTLISIKRI